MFVAQTPVKEVWDWEWREKESMEELLDFFQKIREVAADGEQIVERITVILASPLDSGIKRG